jgi:hypothetical protein
MKSACKIAPLSAALMAILLHGAAAQDLSSKPVYDGAVTTRTHAAPSVAASATPSAAILLSVKSWGIRGERSGGSVPQEIPLHGFYLAHLRSGEITAAIGGETTRHSPGDYWAVKPGATMQVTTLGGYAIIETIVISKQ